MPLCLRPGFLFVSMSGQGGHSVGLCRGTIADKYHQSNRPKATKNSAVRPKTVRNTCCFAPRNEPYGNAIRGCVKMWLKGVNRSWTTCRSPEVTGHVLPERSEKYFASHFQTILGQSPTSVVSPNFGQPLSTPFGHALSQLHTTPGFPSLRNRLRRQ